MHPRANDPSFRDDRFDTFAAFEFDDDPGFRPEDDGRPARRPSLAWLALPVVLVGTLIAIGPDRDAKATPRAAGDARSVPFRMLPSNHMVVEAKLNGEGPYRLIFDLGSPVTILSNRAAEGSKALPENAPKSFLFGTRGEGKLETVELGDLTAEDVPVVVMDHPALKVLSAPFGRPIDGIVGYTFFARYKTTIDYKDNEMTFTPVEFEVKDLLAELPKRMLGPKVASTRVLAPEVLLGVTLGEPGGGVASAGVPIVAVLPGSPAAEAGLEPGDTLTTLDGRWTTTPADVYEAVAKAEGPGIPAVVLRDGAEVSVTLTPMPGI